MDDLTRWRKQLAVNDGVIVRLMNIRAAGKMTPAQRDALDCACLIQRELLDAIARAAK